MTDSPNPEGPWLCSICGYYPGNRAGWCKAGCGSDYREMKQVGVVEALASADETIEMRERWRMDAVSSRSRAERECADAEVRAMAAESQLAAVREWAEAIPEEYAGDEDDQLTGLHSASREVLALLDQPPSEEER